jgi:hypothetical protein
VLLVLKARLTRRRLFRTVTVITPTD